MNFGCKLKICRYVSIFSAFWTGAIARPKSSDDASSNSLRLITSIRQYPINNHSKHPSVDVCIVHSFSIIQTSHQGPCKNPVLSIRCTTLENALSTWPCVSLPVSRAPSIGFLLELHCLTWIDDKVAIYRVILGEKRSAIQCMETRLQTINVWEFHVLSRGCPVVTVGMSLLYISSKQDSD